MVAAILDATLLGTASPMVAPPNDGLSQSKTRAFVDWLTVGGTVPI
jgi:hypothetical protein